MAEQRQFVPDWYNESEGSTYPFGDDASFVTDTGLTLGRTAILDAVIYPDADILPRLTAITTDRTSAEFTFSDESGNVVASGTKTHGDGSQAVYLTDPLDRQIGVLVLNEDGELPFIGWPVGEHALDLPLVPTCVIPVVSVVEGFLTEGEDYTSGKVFLVGDAGVVVRPEPDPDPGVPAIRIDLVGDPLFRRRICSPQDRFTTPNFVRTINGLAPNEFGEFPIAVGQHLSPEPIVRIETDVETSRVSFRIIGTGIDA